MAQGSTRVRIGDAVVGSNAIVLTICLDIDDIDLTDADNITGTRRNVDTGVTVPLTGVMTAVNENTFTWQLSIADTLEAGTYEIVFTIDIAGDFARNVSSRWVVWPANSTDLPAPDIGVTAFIRLNPDGTYSFLNAADFRVAIGVSASGDNIPLISPAVAGNLAVQTAGGELEDGRTGIVLEQDPLQPTAARNRLATGVAPNTLGVGAVDLQGNRSAATQVASGLYSHAEGFNTTASGTYSHAEGFNTVASRDHSHAEGFNTIASGLVSRAEGSTTTASGAYSHASGRRAQATQAGTYARADSLNADFPTIIADEYAVRARGGVRLVTATDGAGVATKTTTVTPAGIITLNDDTSRNAQLTELRAVNYGAAQTLTAPQQVQARANINAETAGAAATVQGNLTTHEGLTGTAVHGLGTASTLTSGATGAALVGAATVTAARSVLELPPPTSPPIYTLHNGIATKATVVTGSGAVTAGQPDDLASGATALSTARLNVGASALSIGYGNARWDWSRRFEFFGNLRRQTANAEGIARIFYGKRASDAFGVVAAGDYVAVELANGVPTSGIVAKAGVVTTVIFASPPVVAIGMNWYITSNNGTVSWWSNNVLLGTTTAGPSAAGVVGQIVYELQNGATAADFRLVFVSASNGYL